MVATWLRALRLPFYPMSWLGYTLGASLVIPLRELWSMPAYWWGYTVVFLVEALTVFVNDLYDFESDRRNRSHGNFSGGSRVLVEHRLTPADLKRACRIVLAGVVVAGVWVQLHSPAPVAVNLALIATALILGVGYTAPPLKLSHRGCGEITVALVHSFLVIQCGAAVVGGEVGHPGIVETALPLFLAIIPSISISGLPDVDADRAAGKRTLAVKLGPRPVIILAVASSIAAAMLVTIRVDGWPTWALWGVCVHALLVAGSAFSIWRRPAGEKVDGVIAMALACVLWFTLVPLAS
ncbi:prenyltransferase [Luteolibacter flavescens]|uniref:Prenyltransferase n=1 Tax=Luteolibacter flavescens TaxID=1859460 RepID=A0ABT3FR19_9BACT|nr:prenyltransferase [Luteolibacter flavescens]MCW1886023.1 prenyltransferase [Luteolibacter flavescens]